MVAKLLESAVLTVGAAKNLIWLRKKGRSSCGSYRKIESLYILDMIDIMTERKNLFNSFFNKKRGLVVQSR